MADAETVTLDAPHAPHPAALEAFVTLESAIKRAIEKSRHDWDKHEPRMWSRVSSLSNEELISFDVNNDLVEVRSGPTAYGTIIFGKIKLPAVNDDQGEGFIHARIHHTPGEPVKFHAIRTEETIWTAVLPADYPLEFFSE